MMIFREFRDLLQGHVLKLMEDAQFLFVTAVDRDVLWETYLDSFPEGTNEIYRERREHDCSCCRHFIKSFGNVVSIKDNKIVSIWDFETGESTYGVVTRAMAELVKSEKVVDVFVTDESGFGTVQSFEKRENGEVHKWDHFRVDLPKSTVVRSGTDIPGLRSKYRDTRNVFQRSLEEITSDAIETLLDLISQNSLYKGEEWGGVLRSFLSHHQAYWGLSESEKDNYCWSASVEIGEVVGRVRNHSIGTLLTNISEGMDLDTAVRKYEAIVAPSNYKRPKAIFTAKMVEQARQTVAELGLGDSLGRRYAIIEDITVNDILFANRDVLQKMSGDVFSDLEKESVSSPKKFGKVEEITAEKFVEEILPRVRGCEVFLEGRHIPSLVSVIAPKVKNSPSMFKWSNGFSWAYNGNITDSMKQRVKAAGGNVEGVLRFSLQWNEEGDNRDDLDAHCIEPNGNEIWFQNKGRRHPSTGMLDVDIIEPRPDEIAVENITWTDISRMQEGTYQFFVHNYTDRGGRSGFKAEIEYEGQVYSYEYNKSLRQGEIVEVAYVDFSRQNGLKFIKSLDSSFSSKTVWGLQTNQFHPVSACMYSPNYWKKEEGVGNRHYFFILKGCLNDTQPNGFFNEFLREDLMKHKRVFEALGSKMRVEMSDAQLSGVGFSSTKRNSVICRLSGNVTRVVRVNF
jgi:hypothetical protein